LTWRYKSSTKRPSKLVGEMMRAISIAAAASALLAGSIWAVSSEGRERSAVRGNPAVDTSGLDLDLSAIDPTADACQDFYQRACGGFIARTKLTPEQPEISLDDQTFNANLETNLGRLFAKPAPPNSELGRLETFYSSCRSDNPSNAAVVKSWLSRIDAARSRADIQSLIFALSEIGVDPFFTYSGQPDPQRLDLYRGEIDYSNLWQDPAVVARAFEDSGLTSSAAQADAVRVGSVIAELKKFRTTSDNPADYENPRTLAQLRAVAPAIDWRRYFELVGASPARRVNLTSARYLPAVSRELATRQVADLRAYLRWTFLFSLRGELPAPYNLAFGDLAPAFRINLTDRFQYCRDATVRAMGVEFSRQYSMRILGERARQAATEIARSIRDQIVASVGQATWLSPAARRRTMAKLQQTDLKIGFPDHWPEVGKYPLSRTAFFQNVLSARRFEQQRAWRRANQPRSRKAWEMIVSPWVGDGMAAARLVVPNGFPDPNTNSLIMTAAFLTPPRFNGTAPLELNYGSFGSVFAHEFVHIAENHEFDAEGHQKDIWSKADLKAWDEQRQCVIDQAASYPPPAGAKVSPASNYHSYSENVADLGGLRLAYEALAAKLGPRLDQRDASGFTPAQRFFYKYAQHWCTAATPDDLRKRAESDSHALPAYRTNGPLSNMPEFGQAFGCKPGSPMMRPAGKICRVW
jgi:putative endopeptidase